MSRVLWLALSFVVLTVPLTWLWVVGDGRELFARHFFVPVAGAVYDLLGLDIRPVWRERYIHYVPFVALVALTPGLGVWPRLRGLVGGLAAMVACDIAINGFAQYGHRRPVDLPLPAMLLSDALPFLVWAVVARRYLSGLARGAFGPSVAPAVPAAPADEGADVLDEIAREAPAEPADPVSDGDLPPRG